MKKVLLFACAIAAMVSCAKTEVVDINLDDPNIIGFSTYVGATRADVTSANIITGSGVGVYALISDTDISSATSYYIPNAKLTGGEVNEDGNVADDAESTYYTPVLGQWSTETSYYWPVTNALDFYAYYPFAGADNLASLTAGVVDDTDDTKWPIAATADDQADYLAGIVTNQTNTGSAVMLDLDHLLSKVDFRVGVQSEISSAILAVTIHSIELEGIEDAHDGLDLSVPALKTKETTAYSYAGAYTYAAAADVNSPAAENIALVEVATGDGIDAVDGKTLTDAKIFGATEDDTDDLLDPGEENTNIATYADINSGTATTGAESFKLLPQTLSATSTTLASQKVTISYSVTQNGYDIVGDVDFSTVAVYDYTVIFWASDENQGKTDTSGFTATGSENNLPTVLTSPATTDPEVAASATVALNGFSWGQSEDYYSLSSTDLVTIAEIEALDTALTEFLSDATNNNGVIKGYTLIYTPNKEALVSENVTVATKSFDLYTTNVPEWKPGCSYIYTILFAGADNGLGGGTSGDGTTVDLGAAKIYFDVMVNEWATDDDEVLEKEAEDEVE